ncbi:MAG: branched-chain amino acid ABC transporter permease [Acetobacteraceae bacterium]
MSEAAVRLQPAGWSIRHLAGVVVLLAVLAALPAFANNYYLEVLSEAWFYVLLCLGLNIVVGYAGLLDLGYAAFFAVGAYTAGIVTLRLGLSFWLSLPISVIAASIAGVIIGGPTLRLRSDYLAIVTLGFGEMVRISVRNLAVTGGASGMVGINRPYLLGYHLNSIGAYYYIFLLLAVLGVIASHRLEHSRIGRAWKYVRSDEDAARAMGINHALVKLAAYILGAIFAAIGGCFYAAKMTAISPETFTFNQSLLILLGVVLGGRGKIPGVILGALVIVIFPELFRDIGSMRMLVFAISLLLIMLFRPAGIWPEKWR